MLRSGTAIIDRHVDLADAAFRQGDESAAARHLRTAFAQGASQNGAALVPVALRLLEIESDPSWRQRYLEHLAKHDAQGQAFAPLLARSIDLVDSTDPNDLPQAWTDLSWAYELASDSIERRQALDQLEPLLDRHVFSGRYSPLLKRYNVKEGDNLTRIARQFETTIDSIVRLSSLKSTEIQPRVGLRILPGRASVLVDKSDFRLWVKIGDRVLLERPVGLGEANSTPIGRFVVEVRQKDPTWYIPGEPPIPAGDPRNVLGTRWLGFQDTEEVSGIGIHGTVDNDSIQRESSKGCIRMLRDDVELVFDFVPRGAVVVIRD